MLMQMPQKLMLELLLPFRKVLTVAVRPCLRIFEVPQDFEDYEEDVCYQCFIIIDELLLLTIKICRENAIKAYRSGQLQPCLPAALKSTKRLSVPAQVS